MQLQVKSDISPCVVHCDETDTGVVLVPGAWIDTDKIGIVNPAEFVRQHGWAFVPVTRVEDMTAEPGRKRNVERDSLL